MAFLPAQQPQRPQNVAMKIRETDYSVFPVVSQVDLKRLQQSAFEQMSGKLNAAVLDRHYHPAARTMTDGERNGFTRCNGNIIAPPVEPQRPWEPRVYQTREHWQRSPDAIGYDERIKTLEAEKMVRAKDYHNNFTKQPPQHNGRAVLALSPVHGSDYPGISGFQGLGKYSAEQHNGKAQGALHPAANVPPWLQDDVSKQRSHNSVPRRNPSMYSEGIASVLGDYAGPSPYMPGPGGSVEKGVAYPTHRSAKRSHYVADSTGGHASPPGSRMPGREDGTTHGSSYHLARMEALSQGRAHTSMLP